MPKKAIALAVIVIAIIGVGVYLSLQTQQQNPIETPSPTPTPTPVDTSTPTPTQTPSVSPTANGDFKVTNLSNGAVLTSPFTVTGSTGNSWYFEASFPVKVIDGNGKLLQQTHATALSDWMKPGQVPFSVALSFSNPTTATGTIIFAKDNPSGLPANDLEVRIPVTFSH